MRPRSERPDRPRNRTISSRRPGDDSPENAPEPIQTRQFRRRRRPAASDATVSSRRAISEGIGALTVTVWLSLTAAAIALTAVATRWLNAVPVDTARVARPFARQVVVGLGLGALRDWSVVIAGLVTVTGCLLVTVVAVRLVVRLHARRAVTGR